MNTNIKKTNIKIYICAYFYGTSPYDDHQPISLEHAHPYLINCVPVPGERSQPFSLLPFTMATA